MSDKTLGRITSEPNTNGEHGLKCPKCDNNFLAVITKNDETSAIDNTTCPACGYSDEPKLFVAAAHQTEVNTMAMDYVAEELTKIFKKIR